MQLFPTRLFPSYLPTFVEREIPNGSLPRPIYL